MLIFQLGMKKISFANSRKSKSRAKAPPENALKIKGRCSLACFQNSDSKTGTHSFVNASHAYYLLPCSSVLPNSTVGRSR